MSDEPSKKLTELPHTTAGIHEHWCEHPGCKRWGAVSALALRGAWRRLAQQPKYFI